MRKIILFALFFLFFGFSFSARAYAGGFCFNRAGAYYNVPGALLMAIARVESDFNPRAIDYDQNGSYDYGVMQINTVWYPEIRGIWRNLDDPCQNITVGAWILKKCFDRYDAVKKAVACYHTGKGRVHSRTAFNYVNKVVYYYKKYEF